MELGKKGTRNWLITQTSPQSCPLAIAAARTTLAAFGESSMLETNAGRRLCGCAPHPGAAALMDRAHGPTHPAEAGSR